MPETESLRQPETRPEIAETIRAYLKRGRASSAARTLIAEGGSDELLRETADLLLQQARWSKAAELLEMIRQHTRPDTLSLNLARNLQAFRRHHPDAYQRLFNTPPQLTCRLVELPDGRSSVEHKRLDGTLLIAGNQMTPEEQIEQASGPIEELLKQREPLAVCSVRDGYVLDWLARSINAQDVHELASAPSQLSSVYVFEPCPEVLIQTFMIQAWHEPGSPITAPWFYWFLGKDAIARFGVMATDDPMLRLPRGLASLSSIHLPVIECSKAIVEQRHHELEQLRPKVMEHARSCTAERLEELFGDNPPRPPRVIVVTSLFTSVLRFSAKDVCDSLRELGWEVEYSLETSQDRRLSHLGLWRKVLDFKPDCFFLIDHNRHEYNDMFPEPIPVVNWIQDHLSVLCDPRAGQRIGTRDFVLLASRPTYVQKYDYPDRQCIDLAKLSKPPQIPDHWDTTGPDLLYVSNASAQGDELVQRFRERFLPGERCAEVSEAVVYELMDRYSRGEPVLSTREIGRMLDDAVARQGYLINSPTLRDRIRDTLWLPVNDALYRQQGLVWAADIADELGLTLEIYGKGWENHPRLARYAKGTVDYGADLEELTRSAAINLRLEPYPTLSHQRMIDGLFAGGFFLSRRFAPDQLFTDLLTLVDQHAAPGIETLGEARQRIDSVYRDRLDQLAQECSECYGEGSEWDPVVAGRISESIGVLRSGQPALPGLTDIEFNDQNQLRACVQRFVSDPEERRSIQSRQRQAALATFSYTSGMQRVFREIRDRIRTEADLPRRICA